MIHGMRSLMQQIPFEWNASDFCIFIYSLNKFEKKEEKFSSGRQRNTEKTRPVKWKFSK